MSCCIYFVLYKANISNDYNFAVCIATHFCVIKLSNILATIYKEYWWQFTSQKKIQSMLLNYHGSLQII